MVKRNRRGTSSAVNGHTRVLVRGQRSSGSREAADGAILHALGEELYEVISRALARFGVHGRGNGPFAHGVNRHVPSMSERVLSATSSLSELLFEWANDANFLDAAGNPKVLLVRGCGVTFEALAARHLPGVSVEEALSLVRRYGQVSIRRGNKVGLYGSTNIDTAKEKVTSLALAIRQIDRLLNTMLRNVEVARQTAGVRWSERLVERFINVDAWNEFVPSLRAQITDLSDRVDRSLAQAEKNALQSGKAKHAAGVGLYAYCIPAPKKPTSPDFSVLRIAVASRAKKRKKPIAKDSHHHRVERAN